LARYAEVVHAGLGEMRGATAPRLLLEVVCARLLLPSASDTEAALLQRIERLETRLDVSIPADEAAPRAAGSAGKSFVRRSQAPEPTPVAAAEEPKAPTPPPVAAPRAEVPPPPVERPPVEVPRAEVPPDPEPAPPEPTPLAPPLPTPPPPVESAPEPSPPPPVAEPPPPVTGGQPDAGAVRSMWTTVREKVRERRRTTDVMLDGAIVVAVEGDTLVLSHVSAPLAKRLNEQTNVEIIRDALKDALGVNWAVRCEAGSPTTPAPSERGRPGQGERSDGRGGAAAPPPPEEDDEESLLAEAEHAETAPRRDPEEVALELLQNELGARPIDPAR
jgi:DNA polymerase-3 subunit gamma/tau